MKNWLMRLETSERRLVIGGGGLLLLMFLYIAIWEPLTNSVEELRISTTEQESLLVWMRGAAQEVKQLKGSGGQKTEQVGGGSLLSLVDRTAKAARLGPVLKRVQPDGEDKVRVWLEAASFDDLMRWLSTLNSRHDVHAVSSVFQTVEAPGRVDARLVFETSH